MSLLRSAVKFKAAKITKKSNERSNKRRAGRK